MRRLRRDVFVAILTLLGIVPSGECFAQVSDDSVRIGIINDQSGPYSSIMGRGSVIAAQMAVEDFGGSVLGRKIEILSADHQNKPDVGAAIVRRWFDSEHVDMVADVGNSAVALAVQSIARERNKVVIYSAVGTTEITQKQCSPTSFAWLQDTYGMASSLIKPLLKEGNDTWFFILVDYAFGHSMFAEASKIIESDQGKVVGAVRHPLNTSDFSSFLLQAQASKAKTIVVVSGGADLINTLKQADEFGIRRSGQKLVTPLMFISEVHAMGLNAAQGLTFATSFYWDRTDETRSFSRRFLKRHAAMPTQAQAAVYSGVTHYLRSVEGAGTDSTDAVVKQMRATPVRDFFTTNGVIRADGRLMHDLYLVQVKAPSESRYAWDYYKILSVVSADQAAKPLSESECPTVRLTGP
jgi:branched-chain amino acid transport system substrate-binding protein